MRAIDADALEREGWSLCRTFQKDECTMVYEVKKPSDFPAIEERKTGKWIIEPYDVENDIWVHRCGECMKVAMLGSKKSRFNYCPNCGAKMEGEEK